MSEALARVDGETPASRGLPFWRDGIKGRETLDPAAFDALVTHPMFAEACRRSIRVTQALHDSNPQMMRMFQDIQRAFLGIFMLYLDARGGITLAAIQAFCKEIGLTSPGRAAAILLNLRMIGYVVRDPVQDDRRQRRYVPSSETIDIFRMSFRNEALAFSLIEPGAARLADRFHEPKVFRAYVLTLGRDLTNLVKGNHSNDAISLFAGRNSGLAVLHKIATSGAEGDVYPPRQPVNVSVIGLAKQFKVSRSHVLKLLRDAEAQGLIRRDADAATVTLEEPLRAALLQYHAAIFMGAAARMCAALEAVGEEP